MSSGGCKNTDITSVGPVPGTGRAAALTVSGTSRHVRQLVRSAVSWGGGDRGRGVVEWRELGMPIGISLCLQSVWVCIN